MALSKVYPVDGILGKFCSRCETWKPLTEWQRDNTRRRDGLQAYCKECRRAQDTGARERAARWYESHRQYVSERDRVKRAAGEAQPRQQPTQQELEAVYADRAAAATQRARAYERDWLDTNRDRINQQSRERYRKKPLHHRAKGRRWYWKHHDEWRDHLAQKYASNPERYRAYGRAWRHQARTKNPDRCRLKNAQQRRKRYAAPGSHTAQDIHDRFVAQCGECAYCGADLTGYYHVDHMQPISRGGSDNPDNLALACRLCNQRKGARTVEEFFARERRLGRMP